MDDTSDTSTDVLPLVVDRVVENHPDGSHTHEVTLTLSAVQWRQLVGDIARRIQQLRQQGQPITSKLAAAGVRPSSAEQQDALSEVLALLSMPRPSVTLDPGADTYATFIAELDWAGQDDDRDEDSHAAEERRYAEARYRLGGDERGSVGSGLACSLGLFAAFVLVFTSPLWLVALAVLIPFAWLIGAALWDLATAPTEDPYASDWDVRSSHTPDRKRVTR